MAKKAPKGKYAWTVKVGEKGQIVIPKEARDLFDFKPGDTVLLMGDARRGIIIPPQSMVEIIGGLLFEEGTLKEDGADDAAESDKDFEELSGIPAGPDQL